MPVNIKLQIADSLLKLSKEKNIDKITVKDLVEDCGISRQAFYYHFRDIPEVIEWSTEQAFQALLEKTLAAEEPEAVLRAFIAKFDEGSAFLRRLLRSQRREQAERLVVRSVHTYLKELTDRKGPRPNLPDEDREVALRFCTYGIVGLLLECCEDKNADHARLAEQMLRLLAIRMEEIS